MAGALSILLLPAAAFPVSAQEFDANDSGVVDSAVKNSIPPTLSSARGTMTTFLEAFYAEGGPDLNTAASCLDLSGLPASIRMSRGRELAAELKDVLDRTQLINVDAISDDPMGTTWTLPITGGQQIVLDRGDDGRWLFTAATLEDLDETSVAVETQEIVEGVEKTVDTLSASQWMRSHAPSSLRGRALSLEGWQWIGLLVLVLVGAAVARLTVAILQGPLMSALRRWAREVDPDLVRRSLKPLGSLAMVLVWWLGILFLGLPLAFLRWFAILVEVVLIVTAALTAHRLVKVVTDVMEKRAQKTVSRYDDLLVPLIRSSLIVAVWIVAIIFLAETFQRDLTGLFAGLGIGGLAFALAAQDTLGNLFGSLTVLLDRPFQVGDWVVVGSTEGTVEEVGFRSTRIRTFYNSRITLPNSKLTSAAIDNYGERQYRRWSTRLGIAYDTPPEKIDAFCEGIKELILHHPHTRKDYFHVALNEFGASALEIMLYVFFVTPDWGDELKERHRLAVDIIRLARELGVEFAFPTQTLYMRQEPWPATSAVSADDFPDGSMNLQEEARRIAERLVTHAEDRPKGTS
jgi:MscS family membrane protein